MDEKEVMDPAIIQGLFDNGVCPAYEAVCVISRLTRS
jgi:hypothetical protein